MSERAERSAQATLMREVAGATRVGYAPITRVDAERREIELCATSETLDAHGTIFDYAASKEAFTRWLGNVREMHERRAVGRRVAVRCDDETRRIYVRLRISRGAQDTWEKVLDGTLRGASIGASDVIWRRERRTVEGRSRTVSVATRYDLAELSLVDNPSNPDALGVTFVRGATPDVTVLDPLEPLDSPAVEPSSATDEPPEAEAPAREQEAEASPRREPLHEATRTLLAGCACPRCAVALAALGEDATEADQIGRDGAMTRALLAGLRAHVERLAQMDATLSAAVTALHAADERRMAPDTREDEQNGQAAHVVEELRARVARLEAQPMPGGPTARPVDKALAGASAVVAGAEFRALEALAGRLRDPQAQLAVAAEMIRLQQGAEG